MLIVYVLVAFLFKEADVSAGWWVAFWSTLVIDFIRSVTK